MGALFYGARKNAAPVGIPPKMTSICRLTFNFPDDLAGRGAGLIASRKVASPCVDPDSNWDRVPIWVDRANLTPCDRI